MVSNHRQWINDAIYYYMHNNNVILYNIYLDNGKLF